ncbi:MAG: asparagine synthase-related protein, partial [Candidatus Bathycorpusculaceae bacterium]
DESLLDKVQAATFGVKGCDDIRVAGAFTRKIGLKRHYIIEYDLDLTADYAKDVVYLTDGMGTVNISYLPYVMMKLKQSIDVYLQGFAFDLLLGGSFLDKETMRARNISDLVHALDKKYTLFSQSELEHLLGEKLIPFAKKNQVFFMKMIQNARGCSFADKADYFHMNTRVRRYTLYGSVVARNFVEESLPTLDNEVINVIRRIPAEWRYKHRIYKIFLKKLNPKLVAVPYQSTMMRPNMPFIFWRFGALFFGGIKRLKVFFWRLSKGRIFLSNRHSYFDFDEALRIAPTWKRLVARTLLNGDSLCYKLGYLNKDYVHKLVKDHYKGKKNGEKIAFLITFELFLRIFASKSKANCYAVQ